MKDRLPTKVREGSKQTAIGMSKVALSFLGPIGALINEAVFDIHSRYKQARFERVLEYLGEIVQAHDETISKYEEYLKRTEGVLMLESVANASFKTESKRKLKAFAPIA